MLVNPSMVQAAVAPGCDKSSSFLGIPPWYKYLDVGPKETKSKDGTTIVATDPCAIIGPADESGNLKLSAAIAPILLAVFEIILHLAGLLAIGFIIFGGFQYLLSQGEPERTKNARSTILNAIIGLVIVIFSTVIVNVIGGVLT